MRKLLISAGLLTWPLVLSVGQGTLRNRAVPFAPAFTAASPDDLFR